MCEKWRHSTSLNHGSCLKINTNAFSITLITSHFIIWSCPCYLSLLSIRASWKKQEGTFPRRQRSTSSTVTQDNCSAGVSIAYSSLRILFSGEHLYLCVGHCCHQVLPLSENSETERNQACRTTARIRYKGLRWKWRWRCGGGSSCPEQLCKKTASRQGSPNTPRPCRRQEVSAGWLLVPWHTEKPLLSEQIRLQEWWFTPNTQSALFPFLQIPLTHWDNMAPPFCFPAATSSQGVFTHELRPLVKPGDLHNAAPQTQTSPSCCCQTASGFCWWG